MLARLREEVLRQPNGINRLCRITELITVKNIRAALRLFDSATATGTDGVAIIDPSLVSTALAAHRFCNTSFEPTNICSKSVAARAASSWSCANAESRQKGFPPSTVAVTLTPSGDVRAAMSVESVAGVGRYFIPTEVNCVVNLTRAKALVSR